MGKRLICLLAAILCLTPTASAWAVSSVALVSPANALVTTDNHPTFIFDYDSTSPDEWSLVEAATAPGMGSDGAFYFENVVLYSGPLDYPVKSYRDSSALDWGHYYWHALHYNYAEGNFSVSPLREITIVTNTFLNLKIKPKKVNRGKAITISGRLTDSNGQSAVDKSVIIKANGKKIKTLKTDILGNFSFKTRPKKTSTYKAVFSGDGIFLTSTSKNIRVVVQD